MTRGEPIVLSKTGAEIAGKAVVDAAPAIDRLIDRFGFPASLFERFVVVQLNREYLGLVDRGCDQPLPLVAESLGLRFLRIAMVQPTLAAEATLMLAPHATRHVIELDAEQALAQLTRQPFRVSRDQLESCSSPGQVLFTHQRQSVGAGLFRTLEPSEAPESMFPRAWCLQLEHAGCWASD